jgi:hypothetical protein
VKFFAVIVSIREQSRIKAAPPFIIAFPAAAQPAANSIAPPNLTESRLRGVRSVMGSDLITGGDPYVIMSSYVLQRFLQILMAEWSVDDKWMEAKRHDAPGLRALLIKLIELINSGLIKRFAREALADEHADVVELDRIGD